MKVRDLMTHDIVTVQDSASLKTAARMLVEHGISGMPVIADGRVVGVFSERDLLFKEQGRPERKRWIGWLIDPTDVSDQPKLEAHKVRDAMTSPPITINANETVAGAARLMLQAGVSRLPVIENSVLAGIVTRADLVRAFARTDDEINTEITEDVVGRWALREGEAIEASVENGDVTLTGRLHDRDESELLTRLVGRVPGVTSVETQVKLAV